MGGGFTALLGKSIAIGARALVFYRVVMVALTMAVVMVRRRVPFRTSPRRLAELVAVGALVGCHWVTFYATIKLAGIAVAVVCLSTGTFFTALLEPLILRRRVRWHELVLGAGVVLGVGLLLRFEVGASLAGYALGLFAALCGAAFGTWNARLGKLEPREKITFIELSSAAVFVGVSFALTGGFVPPTAVSPRARAPARPRARAPARPRARATGDSCSRSRSAAPRCRGFGHYACSRRCRPTRCRVSVALPVYSLFFAYLVWPTEERLGARFYAGAVGLVGLVVANAWLKKREVPAAAASSPAA
ncbi:MAG TPA: EamA family transporter [Polyangiaceae bacterium]|nr:EamA family transporter [Polyangiaceae bacterium]